MVTVQTGKPTGKPRTPRTPGKLDFFSSKILWVMMGHILLRRVLIKTGEVLAVSNRSLPFG